jgi:hypothetical protein
MIECKTHRRPIEYQCTSSRCSVNPKACHFCLADHFQHPELIVHIGFQAQQTQPSAFKELRGKIELLLQAEL